MTLLLVYPPSTLDTCFPACCLYIIKRFYALFFYFIISELIIYQVLCPVLYMHYLF